MRFRCIVKPRGNYYMYPIYSPDPRVEITDIAEAAKEAEKQFGSDWEEVFNKSERIKRCEYVY